VVFVRQADGMLVPRAVVLGTRGGGRVQVMSGLAAGETIVASANFLVDAESRLASTGGGMPGMQHGTEQPTAESPGMAMPPAPVPAAGDSMPGGHIHD